MPRTSARPGGGLALTRALLLLAAFTFLAWAWRRWPYTRAFSATDIARLFDVPPRMLGRRERPLDLGPELGIDADRLRYWMAALDSEPEWPIRDPRPDWLLEHDADWLRERLEGWL